MNELPAKLKARAQRKNAKREEKKRQIADSAIEALKELGYANTSLRDIAEKSDLSLGMLHYYFEDRTDLIIYCVSVYKEEFVRDITDALEAAQGREGVILAFSEGLATAIVNDSRTHRLWYDIRNQAMFDVTFHPIISEIEEKLTGIVRTAFRKAGVAAPENVAISYALLDGVFQYFMRGQIGANAPSHKEVASTFRALLEQFL